MLKTSCLWHCLLAAETRVSDTDTRFTESATCSEEGRGKADWIHNNSAGLFPVVQNQSHHLECSTMYAQQNERVQEAVAPVLSIRTWSVSMPRASATA